MLRAKTLMYDSEFYVFNYCGEYTMIINLAFSNGIKSLQQQKYYKQLLFNKRWDYFIFSRPAWHTLLTMFASFYKITDLSITWEILRFCFTLCFAEEVTFCVEELSGLIVQRILSLQRNRRSCNISTKILNLKIILMNGQSCMVNWFWSCTQLLSAYLPVTYLHKRSWPSHHACGNVPPF